MEAEVGFFAHGWSGGLREGEIGYGSGEDGERRRKSFED
jgi:hypothetical protein